MPKYMFEANYTRDGLQGLAAGGGTARRDAIESMLEGQGGKLEALYFAQGESAVVLIVDLPDDKALAAIVLAVTAAGAVTNTKTRLLLSPEEMDEVARTSVDYLPPGHGLYGSD